MAGQASEEITNIMKPQSIYLLIGQSNMAGRAEITASESEPLDGVLLYDDEGNWIPADNPLNRFSTVRKKLGMQHLGPGYAFARDIRPLHGGKPFGLVVTATGGTSILKWQRGEELYDAAMTRVKEALTDSNLKGVLWHQGEIDHADPEYLPKLVTLVQQLREDLTLPELPFVAGRIYNSPAINEQISRLPDALPHCGVATAEDTSCFDGLHFDTPSALLLGSRYAAEMQKLIEVAS